MPAFGFIETTGRIGAIESADAALKAADVKLISIRKVTGGLVTVIIEGKVAAVQASVNAAKERARQLSETISTTVIPRPDDAIIKAIREISDKPLGPGVLRSQKTHVRAKKSPVRIPAKKSVPSRSKAKRTAKRKR
ncbi:MAG: BMC domain-containing protein [Candidatus Hodarchaeales archaeon]